MEERQDLISRQAAIDALDEYFGRIGKLERRGLTKGERAISLDVVGAIRTLPSAQPVITCDGCKFVGTYDTDFPCRNCIRREKDYYAQE